MPKPGEVVAFRSGQLYESEMVEQALAQAGIPCYRLTDELGLGELTMPALPAMGPGVEFLVVVPESAAEPARKVLESMPLSQPGEAGVWAFRPTDRVKIGIRIYAIATLSVSALAAAWSLYSYFR